MFNRNFALLEYGNFRDLPHPPMPMQCYVQSEKSISRKKPGSSIEKFPSLVLPGNTRTVTAPYYHEFPLYYLLVVAYGRLKRKENVKLLALKVLAVAYKRWSFTRGSQCSDLAEKRLVFWKTGR